MKLFFIYLITFTLSFQLQLFSAPMKMIGMKGKASDVSKTIKVDMYDNYYEPKTINVKKGETVRFVVENKGVLVHEFNIATMMMHKKHGPEMLDMMKMGILWMKISRIVLTNLLTVLSNTQRNLEADYLILISQFAMGLCQSLN